MLFDYTAQGNSPLDDLLDLTRQQTVSLIDIEATLADLAFIQGIPDVTGVDVDLI